MWQDVRDLTQNGPWMVLFFLALIIMLTITLRGSTAVYYLKYYVGREDLLRFFVPAYMAAAAAGALLSPVMTRFVDKKLLLIILMTITGILSCAFFFIPKDQIWLMFALQIVTGRCWAPSRPSPSRCTPIPPITTNGAPARRATAMTFAAATFSQKLGTALAAAMMGSVFAALGYVANAEQTPESKTGIVLLMSFIPALFAFLAAAVMLFYKLDNAQMARIQIELAQRKAAGQNANLA